MRGEKNFSFNQLASSPFRGRTRADKCRCKTMMVKTREMRCEEAEGSETAAVRPACCNSTSKPVRPHNGSGRTHHVPKKNINLCLCFILHAEISVHPPLDNAILIFLFIRYSRGKGKEKRAKIRGKRMILHTHTHTHTMKKPRH